MYTNTFTLMVRDCKKEQVVEFAPDSEDSYCALELAKVLKDSLNGYWLSLMALKSGTTGQPDEFIPGGDGFTLTIQEAPEAMWGMEISDHFNDFMAFLRAVTSNYAYYDFGVYLCATTIGEYHLAYLLTENGNV